MEVGVGPCHIVLDGDAAPLPKKGHNPQFSAMTIYCGQTAGWIKMPLGTKVDLGPGHIVRRGHSCLAKGAQQPPPLRPCLVWPRSPVSDTTELLFHNRVRKEMFNFTLKMHQRRRVILHRLCIIKTNVCVFKCQIMYL